MTTTAPAPKVPATSRSTYAKLGRRSAIAAAIMVLLLIPTVALFAINREAASTWATIAGLAGLTTAVAGGMEFAVMSSVVMGLLAPVAIVAGVTPLTGAAAMALMCLMVGRLSRFGLHRATLLIPILMAWLIINPPLWGGHPADRTDANYLGWMAAIFFVGALVPALVLPFALKKVTLPAPKPNPRGASVVYTVTITVLTSGATYVILGQPAHAEGAWLIATILVLTQVGEVGTFRLTVQRVAGTLVGVGVVALIVTYAQSMALIYAIGVACGFAAIVAKFGPRYWLYTSFVTPAIICLNSSSSSQAADLGRDRAQDTLIGAALVVASALVAIGYAHVASRHGLGPTQQEAVDAGSAPAIAHQAQTPVAASG